MEFKFYLDKKAKLVGKNALLFYFFYTDPFKLLDRFFSKIPMFLYCETD